MSFYNNWATFKYNSGNLYRNNFFDKCTFTVNKKSTQILNLKQAMQQAVLSLPDKIGVFYSGGLDSEIIILEMLENNIVPNLYFIDFEYNYHDKQYAIKFCEKYNLKLNFINVDIIDFLKNKIFDYCEYGCNDLAVPLNFHCRKLIDEDVNMISGIGDPPLFRSIVQFVPKIETGWIVGISENSEISRLYFSQKFFPKDVPIFFKYTAELAIAYLKDPVVEDFVYNERYKSTITSSKYSILSKFYELEQRPKYTGFEYIDKRLRVDTLLELEKNVSTRHLLFPYNKYCDMIYEER